MKNTKYQYLSSSFTLFYKFAIPIVILIVTFFVVNKLIHQFQNDYEYKSWELLFFILVPLIYWFLKLKPIVKIKSNGYDYIISDYFSKVAIDVNEVEEVIENNILGKLITLRFNNETKFGKKVVFIPQKIPTPEFNKYPLVGVIAKISNLKVTSELNRAYKQYQ